jgi:hypothetical protein
LPQDAVPPVPPLPSSQALLTQVSPLQQSPSTSQKVASSPQVGAAGSPASSPVPSSVPQTLFRHERPSQHSGSVSQKSPVCPQAGAGVPASSPLLAPPAPPSSLADAPHVPALHR